MFPYFPYTNFHRLNADWILSKVKELATTVERVAAEVATWADRITQAETDAAHAVKFTNQQLTQDQQGIARSNIGAAPRIGVVYYNEAMALSDNYKTQARTNIGAAASEDLSDVVRTSAQTLTAAQQAQARTNISAASTADIPDVSDVVRTSAQSLTAAQQAQARTNISAASTSDLNNTSQDLGLLISGLSNNTVHLSAQSLTAAQQAQARTNIGAAVAPLVVTFSGTTADGDAACDKTWAEIQAAGKNIKAWYQSGDSAYELIFEVHPSSVRAHYYYVPDGNDPTSYLVIDCYMASANIEITFDDAL